MQKHLYIDEGSGGSYRFGTSWLVAAERWIETEKGRTSCISAATNPTNRLPRFVSCPAKLRLLKPRPNEGYTCTLVVHLGLDQTTTYISSHRSRLALSEVVKGKGSFTGNLRRNHMAMAGHTQRQRHRPTLALLPVRDEKAKFPNAHQNTGRLPRWQRCKD